MKRDMDFVTTSTGITIGGAFTATPQLNSDELRLRDVMAPDFEDDYDGAEVFIGIAVALCFTAMIIAGVAGAIKYVF